MQIKLKKNTFHRKPTRFYTSTLFILQLKPLKTNTDFKYKIVKGKK